jgi:hypothetical protein
VLVARGPSFAPGERDAAAAADVEATLADLLGLTPFGTGRSLVAA